MSPVRPEVDDLDWERFVVLADAFATATVRGGEAYSLPEGAARDVLRMDRRRKGEWPGLISASYVPVLDPNVATLDELIDLPGLGPKSAGAIVAHRHSHGPFYTRSEVSVVPGVSRSAYREAAPFLWVDQNAVPIPFSTRSEVSLEERPHADAPAPSQFELAVRRSAPSSPKLTETFAVEFRSYVAALMYNGMRALEAKDIDSPPTLALLELERMSRAIELRPYAEPFRSESTTGRRLREYHRAKRQELEARRVPLSNVAPLRNSDYVRAVEGWFAEARSRIWVQLFVLNAQRGSTVARVIESLAEARARGVDVRVLQESDESGDEQARRGTELFEALGIPVRLDPKGLKSHTKAIVLDEAHVILGTHNWSGASWYATEELSVYLHSEGICQQQAERFEALWGLAVPERDDRNFPLGFLQVLDPEERSALASAGLTEAKALRESDPAQVPLPRPRVMTLQAWIGLMLDLGIPERIARQLMAMGILSAEELRGLTSFELQQRYSGLKREDVVVGRVPFDLRLMEELRGSIH